MGCYLSGRCTWEILFRKVNARGFVEYSSIIQNINHFMINRVDLRGKGSDQSAIN